MEDNIKSMHNEKNIRRDLYSRALLCFAIVLVLILASIAWFTNNKEAIGEGINMNAEELRFQLASVGKSAVYNKEGMAEGESKIIGENTYYLTGKSKTSVSWMVGSESNLNNTVKEESLQPDTSGTFKFSVIPLVDDLRTINFTITIKAYVPALLNEDKTPVDSNAIKINGSYYNALDKSERVCELLDGHLLFFSSYSTDDRYSGQIMADTPFNNGVNGILKANTTSEQGKHLDYSIYWIWPGWIKQYVNRSANEANRLFSKTEDYNKMITFINSNRKNFFAENTASGAVPITIPNVSENMSTDDLKICSNYYNNGDELIGATIKYIQLELTAVEEQ